MQTGAERLYLCVLAFVVGVVSAEENVHWVSPSVGDHFVSGDNIVGKWTSSKTIISPSFRLCQGPAQSSIGTREEVDLGSGSCGSRAYPTVQQDSGVYYVSLTVPNITRDETYSLQMIDDFGNVIPSPTFSLSSSGSAPAPRMNEQEVSPNTNGGVQKPMAVNPIAATQGSQAQLVTVTPVPIVVNPTTDAVPSFGNSSLAATRPSTAAWAVPVSIAGTFLLAALFFALRQHKTLGAQRRADMEKVHEVLKAHSEKPQSVIGRSDGSETTLPSVKALNGVQGFGFGSFPAMQAFPIPLFMPPADLYPWSKKEAQYEAHYTPPPPRYSGRSSHRSSRSLSARSHVASRYSVSSRPVELPDHSSVSSFPRPPSLSSRSSCSSRSSRTRVCLPPIEAGMSLFDEQGLGKLSKSLSGGGDSAITSSVLEDCELPPPPPCLVPAPQRVQALDEGPMEEKLVNPYDAVAANLRNARRS
ncbi:hypothetical protein L218DRAFT_1001240 [Marasmius fiardii PR-910]|nr:hypothetical protein L218DRAFT_1001240 [Marasmius fiardii PR-910]